VGKVSNVKCSVNECVYWGAGDVCEAEAIEINRNVKVHEGFVVGPGRRGMETGHIGDLGSRIRKGSNAWTSEHTMCRTFRPRPQGQ